MQRKLIAAPLAAAALTLAAAGPAHAGASPQAKNGHYVQNSKNVIVAIFDVKGGEIRSFSHNDACTRYPLLFPTIKFGKGKFAFKGDAIKDLNSQEWSVRLKGKSVSSTVIAGTVTYTKTKGNAPCSTTTKFKVKRTGKARS